MGHGFINCRNMFKVDFPIAKAFAKVFQSHLPLSFFPPKSIDSGTVLVPVQF